MLDASSRKIRTVVIRPGIVYGRGGGIPASFLKSAAETGAAIVAGNGENHWTFVHIDDLADLYVKALDAPPGTLLNAASGEPLKVNEVALAAAAKVQHLVVDEAFKTMGPWVECLVLDQRISSKRAQQLLGWTPRARSILDELRRTRTARG